MTKRQTTTIGNTGALHLVDAENLCGDAYPGKDEALEVLGAYGDLAHGADGDLYYLAANRYLTKSFVFDSPLPGRVRMASGRDGADLALLADAEPSWVCRRFTRLVIGSGDHIFGGLAGEALQAGLEVVVIGRPGSVARIYERLGCDVRYLDLVRPQPPAPGVIDLSDPFGLAA